MAIELSGPYLFNPASIDATIVHTYPGVYALGYMSNNVFYIQRVGRSDVDLNARLKSDEYKGKYSSFKAKYYLTADEAFHAECELWHSFGGTKNPLHPDRPKGTKHKCNHCNSF